MKLFDVSILERRRFHMRRDMLARTFEYAIECGYDIAAFVDAFMQSEIARSMDSVYSSYHNMSPRHLVPLIAEKCGLSKSASEQPSDPKEYRYQIATAHDIATMYRYWQVTRETTSAKINKIAPYNFIEKFSLVYDHYGEFTFDCIVGESMGLEYDYDVHGWRLPPLEKETT